MAHRELSESAQELGEEDDVSRDLSGRTLNHGRLILREKLGAGGHAVVYRCDEPLLERQLVVKILHQTRWRSERAQERFRREARLASLLDHPHAAHVYAYDIESQLDGSELAWIAMEEVQGVSLESWLECNGPMPLDQLVPYFDFVGDVVDAAHQKGIVHRDLKPSNMMVIESGERKLPKLIDFGIAKAIQEAEAEIAEDDDEEVTARVQVKPVGGKRTSTGPARPMRRRGSGSARPLRRVTGPVVLIGSAAYMSPEQWLDARHVGPATDIYALGIVIYECLTGRMPFPAKNLDELCQQHLEMPFPPLGGDFPPVLDGVLRKATHKDPSKRYRSAVELAKALATAQRSSPREQLRVSAQQWDDNERPAGLLWGADVLAVVDGQVPAAERSPIECSFVAASQRRARNTRWLGRASFALVGAAAIIAAGFALWYRGHMAEQLVTNAEAEQGRQALLYGQSSSAVAHLETAYRRGDDSLSVTFPLARALQPRMSEISRFTSNLGRMWSARFSPDGTRIVTTDDNSAQVWDAASHHLLFRMMHSDAVYQAVYTGPYIVTASKDGRVGVWDAATGAAVRKLRANDSATVPYYALATSSHVVAATDLLGTTSYVWNIDTGAQIAQLKNDGGEMAMAMFSRDGRWLATSGGEHARIFDTKTWQQTALIDAARIRSMSFDPTGEHLAIGTDDGEAAIWDTATGTRSRYLRTAGASVDAITFSSDGALVATGCRDGVEQLWDARAGGLRSELNSHHARIYALEFAPAGDIMLSAGADGAVAITHVATGTEVARLEGPRTLILTAHFDPQARRVVGASWDGTARLWDTASPYRRWSSEPIGADCDTMDNLEPERRFLAVSCRDHGTRVLDTARGELVAQLPIVTSVSGDFFSALPALSARGDRAAIAHGNRVDVYELPSGRLLRTVNHPGPVNAVAFAPSGHDLISGAVDGTATLSRDGQEPIPLLRATGGIDAVAVLPDGRQVVADARGRLRVFDTEHRLLNDLATPSRVRLIRSSPDATRLLTISIRSQQAPPVLWDLRRGEMIGKLAGHVGRVFSARFATDGSSLLTSGADGSIRRWNARTGQPTKGAAHVFLDDSHFQADAVLSPDETFVVGAGSDGMLRFWDAGSGRLLWRLQAHKSHVIGLHFEGEALVSHAFNGDVARWVLPEPSSTIDACHAVACAPASAGD